MIRTWCLALAAFVCLAPLTGCVTVPPYEREYLSRPSMDATQTEDSEMSFQAHVHDSREGATGGGSSTGGGCGCN